MLECKQHTHLESSDTILGCVYRASIHYAFHCQMYAIIAAIAILEGVQIRNVLGTNFCKLVVLGGTKTDRSHLTLDCIWENAQVRVQATIAPEMPCFERTGKSLHIMHASGTCILNIYGSLGRAPQCHALLPKSCLALSTQGRQLSDEVTTSELPHEITSLLWLIPHIL